MTALSPLKVDSDTHDRIGHLSHFLGSTRKDIVREAVELLWTQKAAAMRSRVTELNEQVEAALALHDGTTLSALSVLTGFTAAEIADVADVSDLADEQFATVAR